MQPDDTTPMKEASLYERIDGRVRCNLCAHRCLIEEGKRGICHVRENRDGTLYTLVYGRTIAQHVDPVEKKPLFHFHPGSTAYSIATPGCNFQCRWCQNWEISQMPKEVDLNAGRKASPEQIVASAQKAQCRIIAYTYTEPTIFFEYAYDVARLARDAGLANVFITNGYMTEEMLECFHPYLDAVNVDLKAFKDETYKRYVGARLEPVLNSLRTLKRLGIWLEVTTLAIPGINDDAMELRDAASFVAEELGADTPWHISRFFPAYKMANVPPTHVSKLQEAREIGLQAGLRYVYLGNVGGGEDTACHNCGKLLVRRSTYQIIENRVQPDGQCPDCGVEVGGVGMGNMAR